MGRTLTDTLVNTLDRITQLMNLAAQATRQSDEQQEPTLSGRSVLGRLEDVYLRLRLWGDDVGMGEGGLKLKEGTELSEVIGEIFRNIGSHLDAIKDALGVDKENPKIDEPKAKIDLDSLLASAKQLSSLVKPVKFQLAGMSTTGLYSDEWKTIRDIQKEEFPKPRTIRSSSKMGSSVYVRHLPLSTTKDDVENFFVNAIPDAFPLVGPIVRDPLVDDVLCTTVTFGNEDARESACSMLDGKVFLAAQGDKMKVKVSSDFLGVNTIAEHEDPQFDFYFVHGPGGHPFDSWASLLKKDQSVMSMKMWPRDLLPCLFESAGLRWRFSTVGYRADMTYGIGAAIFHAARELLSELHDSRPQGCTRPIFFCAHSLGGLVVAQALILAFDKERPNDEYMYLNDLVKGVAFFGTPFWGSGTADGMLPFVSALTKLNPYNTTVALPKSKTNDYELTELVHNFSQARDRHQTEVQIYFESNPVDSPFRTHPGPSGEPLAQFVDPVPINASHVGMIKFSEAQDPKFRTLATSLVDMTKRKLDLSAPTTDYPHRSKAEMNLHYPEGWDIVLVVDDTGSMRLPRRLGERAGKTRWDMLAGALRDIVGITVKWASDGVDVYFLNHKYLNGAGIRDERTVLDLLSQVDLKTGRGGTFFEPILRPILGRHLSRYTQYYNALGDRNNKESPLKVKPLNIIVLTDGAADDEKATERLLAVTARQLDDMFAPSFQIGIQFVQVGDDPEATSYLKRLDDSLGNAYSVRNMVDTMTFDDLEYGDGSHFGDQLVKILVGAMDRGIDG